MERPLLPSGLYDLLPPEAQQRTDITHRLLSAFAHFAYEQVTPPLMEFEDTLLAGRGESLSRQTYRVMDPLSQKMMGLRADMTYQVGRIAMHRLGSAPKPLRLCYAGTALQMKGSTFDSERELLQAGVELIGSTSPSADAEVIQVAVEALASAGVNQITIDLNLPGLVRQLLAQDGITGEDAEEIQAAVERKDTSYLSKLKLGNPSLLTGLVLAAGNASQAFKSLMALDLPSFAVSQLTHAQQVVELLLERNAGLSITLDPAESRGFEYHKTLSFSLFAAGARNEVARGGRYDIGTQEQGAPLEATGITLYVNTLLRICPAADPRRRIFVPSGTPEKDCKKLRNEGYATLYALENVSDADAKTLRCTHILKNGKVETL